MPKILLGIALAIVFSITLSTALTNLLLIAYLSIWLLNLTSQAIANLTICRSECRTDNLVTFIVNLGQALKSKLSSASIINKKITCSIVMLNVYYVIAMFYSPVVWHDKLLALKYPARLLLIVLLAPAFTKLKHRILAVNIFLIATLILITVGNYQGSIFRSVFEAFNIYFIDSKDFIFTSLFVAFSIYCCILNICGSCNGAGNIFSLLKLKHAKSINLIFNISLGIIFIYQLYFLAMGRSGQIIGVLLSIMAVLLQKNKAIIMLGVLVIASFTTVVLKNSHGSTFAYRMNQSINELDKYFDKEQFSINKFIHKKEAPVAAHTSSAGLRMEFALNSIQLFLQKPWFGWGTGSFAAAYNAKFAHGIYANNKVNNPHNQYMLILTEVGIFGALLYAWLLYCLWNAKYQLPAWEQQLLRGVLLTILVGCMWNSWLRDFSSLMFFIIFISMCVGAVNNNTAAASR